MKLERFPMDVTMEEGLIRALEETPSDGPPPPATVPLSGFLFAILIGAVVLVLAHLLLGLSSVRGLLRYGLETALMVVVGVVVYRRLRDLAREGRAVDAKGDVLPRADILRAYKERLFGPSFREIGQVEQVAGLPEPLGGEGRHAVGRTDEHLVFYRESSPGRIHRVGLLLAEVRRTELRPPEGSDDQTARELVVTAGDVTLVLRADSLEALAEALAPGPFPAPT